MAVTCKGVQTGATYDVRGGKTVATNRQATTIGLRFYGADDHAQRVAGDIWSCAAGNWDVNCLWQYGGPPHTYGSAAG